MYNMPFDFSWICAYVRWLIFGAYVYAHTGQGAPYSPDGGALGGYGLDSQPHLGLRTAGKCHIYYI